MTHMRICIDDDVVFDDDLDVWQATPPDYFKDLITPDAKPEPWLKAILVVMSDAVMTRRSMDVDVVTSVDKWLMEVTML